MSMNIGNERSHPNDIEMTNPPVKTPSDTDTDTGEFVSHDEDETSRFLAEAPRQRVRVVVAGKSDKGNVRPTNEDNFIAVKRYRGRELLTTSLPLDMLEHVEDHAYTYAVADGMGGRDFGELASLLALKTGWELGSDEIKWTVKINDREEEELRQKAEVFFQLIHRTLHEAVRQNPRMSGMGTTLTICYTTGPELFVMHAGDSRAYLIRDGDARQLTRDHNMAQVLVDAGAAIAGSAEAKRVRHVLTNCLGGQTGAVTVDVTQEKLQDGDRLLLCSDGLTDMISDKEIAAEITRHQAPSDACHALVELALERGGRDNITVLIAHYLFDNEINRPR